MSGREFLVVEDPETDDALGVRSPPDPKRARPLDD